MWLPNQVVYIQFHPVTYMVKLNIELSMASLITKLAYSGRHGDFYTNQLSFNHGNAHRGDDQNPNGENRTQIYALKRFHSKGDEEPDFSEAPGMKRKDNVIHKRIEVGITVEPAVPSMTSNDSMDHERRVAIDVEDEVPLAYHPGPPSRLTMR